MNVFKIIEHTIPGQHIREHPHSIKGRQEAALQLAIKQYIPIDRSDPIPDNAVTVIGVHGNGAPKVLILPWLTIHITDPSGIVRAALGTTLCVPEEMLGSTACNMDCRRLQSRCKWCLE